MAGILTNKFEVTLRPLRDRDGAQTVVVLETRTAVQASREATARFPEMKVVAVTRVTPTVAALEASRRAAREEAPVLPLRRVQNG